MLNKNHLRCIEEGFRVIAWAVDQGLEDMQSTIGFHCSNIVVNLLEMYLHRLKLLPSDNILKHEWFASKNKIEEKLNFEFKGKSDILELMFEIEEKRNMLCYGKKQKTEELDEILDKLYKLKEIFIRLGLDEIKKFD